MSEAASRRRALWIAWSLRPHLRPSVLAAVIRAHGGAPPEPPVSISELPDGLALHPGELAVLNDREPGLREADRVAADVARFGGTILTPEEGGWCGKFWEEMADPPASLYVRGDLHGVDSPAVAIVGARHASENGIFLARSLARDLAAEGVTIVSGLALGIDGAAHRGALDLGGRTVAVLAGGVDRPSPPSHAGLGDAIASSGALVSEFPPGTDPRPLHFPRRNRILAGLASVVVVVEGRERSGARSTIDHALALGREVCATPRDPVHEGSVLPNGMLRSGACPVTSAADVLALMGPTLSLGAGRAEQATLFGELEDTLLRALDSGRRPIESLAGHAGRSPGEVLASLGRLELAGKVRRLPGGRYERIRVPA